jgi:predicted DNA-binding transcriptional regulator YafY
MLDDLGIFWATLKRDLQYLKHRFNAPIVLDREAGGYRFGKPDIGPRYALPGLWFSGDEAHALITMHQLLSDLEPGLLAPHIGPLLARLEAIVGHDGRQCAEVAERILAKIGMRRRNPEQIGRREPGGEYVLEVPYSDPTEIKMDIPRHGHHVEVLALLEYCACHRG